MQHRDYYKHNHLCNMRLQHFSEMTILIAQSIEDIHIQCLIDLFYNLCVIIITIRMDLNLMIRSKDEATVDSHLASSWGPLVSTPQ